MRVTLWHPPVPLTAPRRPGEVVYTTLQLSRLRRSAINFQRIVIGSLVFFLLAATVLVASSVAADRAKAHDQCVSSNRGRAEIKQAFSDLYDGFVSATGGRPDAVAFKEAQLAKLDKGLPQREC